jgi:simple sugar transport system substrate-binding protein
MAQNRDDANDTSTRDGNGLLSTGRRGLMQGAGLGAALSLLGAAGGGSSALISAAQAAETAFPQHKKWKIVFVNHVTTNPFFVPTQYGIQDACSMLGMDYQWTGSATSDAGEMVRAVNSAIAAKADAIAVPIVDPSAFDKPI